ncbi:MAG: hypothetical protein OEV06_04695, partial [Anaerolineae bacterium]|nr:hypothetical protein [Anaerolineae bacterium]
MNLQRRAKIRLAGAILSIAAILFGFSVHAQEGDFFEPFDDTALPGWERSPNAEVVDGILRIELDGFALHGGEWGDLNLGVRASLDGAGVLVISYRITELGEYAIHINGEEMILQKAGEPIGHEMIEPIPPGEWFALEVISIGEHQEIILNGQLALVAIDPDPLPPGGVGLAVIGDALGQFDDLSVVSLGDTPPPEEPEQEDPGATEGPPPTQEGIATPPAGDMTWVRTGGPPGGIGYDIRYKFDEPNTWLVTDNFAGVHVSTDNGLTWQPSNTGISGQLGPTSDWRPVFSLTIDPHNPDTVWVGTDKTGRIYKSTDGGLTWTQKDNGVITQTSEYDALTFRGFTVDPNSSDTVYAMGEIADLAQGGPLVWSTANGGVVYKTTDGGEHWELIWDGGIPSSLARYMWINPENTDILYVSTGIFDRGAVNEGDPDTDTDPYGGLGILKSTDGGDSWRVLNEANGLDFLYISSLYMHPDDPDILLAAAGKVESELYIIHLEENDLKTKMGVYRTTDGGETWTQVLDVGGFNAVEICLSDTNIAYAGSAATVYRSQDAGVTWTQVAGQGGNGWGPPGGLAGVPIDFQCDPNDPNRIFSNNYVGGNFLSSDGGKTWINASDGYTGAQISSVAVDPNDPAQIYVAGRNGIWSSRDGGSTWNGMRYPPSGVQVWGGEWGGIAIDPSDSQHLLVSEETIWESFD